MALCAAALAAVLVLRDDRGTRRWPVALPTATAAPTPTPTPGPDTVLTGDGLAIGITEQNPHLIWAPGEAASPEAFARRAAELRAMRPRLFRLIVDWSAIQPDPALPADLAHPESGCLRARLPCAPYAGLRDRLRALAARQREGGWETLVAITWTPAWAAAPAGGCERRNPDPRARPPRTDALPAYRALVAALLAVAREEGATLRWWSPWNEPNHPGFISPQRLRCDPRAPSAAVAPYVAIAQALREELAAQPGDQRLALAETAGYVEPGVRHTAADEFVAALPTELVCAADVWTTHAYVRQHDPVGPIAAALERHGCPKPIWITETGVRGDGPGACRALQEDLARWYADPRVGAAFQYTFRTDDKFRTGLVSTSLAERHPTLAVWEAWSNAIEPPADACAA